VLTKVKRIKVEENETFGEQNSVTDNNNKQLQEYYTEKAEFEEVSKFEFRMA
jgi:hypothetical protein